MRTISGIQKWMSVAIARNRFRGAVGSVEGDIGYLRMICWMNAEACGVILGICGSRVNVFQGAGRAYTSPQPPSNAFML